MDYVAQRDSYRLMVQRTQTSNRRALANAEDAHRALTVEHEGLQARLAALEIEFDNAAAASDAAEAVIRSHGGFDADIDELSEAAFYEYNAACDAYETANDTCNDAGLEFDALEERIQAIENGLVDLVERIQELEAVLAQEPVSFETLFPAAAAEIAAITDGVIISEQPLSVDQYINETDVMGDQDIAREQ